MDKKIKVKKHGVILSKTNLDFENKAVLNPAIYQDGKTVHIIYRAINELYTSFLGYARLEGPTKVVERWDHPFMKANYKYESKGMEDPRIIKIKNDLYLIYVAHDGKNAQIAYAKGTDLFKMKKGGLIGPKIRYHHAGKLFRQAKLKDNYYFFESFYKNYGGRDIKIWEKDALLFPEKIKGKYALVHRILPDMQVAYFNELDELKSNQFWVEYLKKLDKYVMLENTTGFEGRHVGGGAPPIKTEHGWLMIYHAVEENNDTRIYHAAAALFDLKDPTKLIAKLPYPLFSPEKDYELSGHVNNVVFPTGTAIFNDKLYIYYGAADSHIGLASVELKKLLDELLKYKN